MRIRAECTRRCADRCCSGNIRWSNIETRTCRYSLWNRRVTSSTGCSRDRPSASPNSCSPRTRCAAVSRAGDRPSPEIHGRLQNNDERNDYYNRGIRRCGVLMSQCKDVTKIFCRQIFDLPRGGNNLTGFYKYIRIHWKSHRTFGAAE